MVLFVAGVLQPPLHGRAIPFRVLLLLLLDGSRIDQAFCHDGGSCLASHDDRMTTRLRCGRACGKQPR